MEMQIAAGFAEFKFADADAAGKVTDLPEGEFRGYLAVFGNLDSHGDVIAPGAFTDTLAQRKSRGSLVPMHAMHGVFGGDGLPIGVFKSADENEKGLRVHGKISGMTTDAGRRHYELLRDGAYDGLSIGYKVVEASKGTRAGEPKRTLIKVDLHEGSLVDSPSNALAKIDEMKRFRAGGDTKAILTLPRTENAAAAIAACMDLHKQCLAGNDSPTDDERAAMFAHLVEAHGHLVPAAKRAGDTNAPRLDAGALAAAFGFLSDFSINR